MRPGVLLFSDTTLTLFKNVMTMMSVVDLVPLYTIHWRLHRFFLHWIAETFVVVVK